MKISDRFTDYLATGGLFWFLQITTVLLCLPLLPAFAGRTSQLISAVARLPPALQTSLAALLGIVGVIVIFFTGMAFDLPRFGLGAWGAQLKVFSDRLRANRVMIESLVKDHGQYLGSEYFCLSEEVPTECSTAQKRKRNKERMAQLERIERFLISSVVASAGTGGIDSLSHAMSLWRLSRATFVILFLGFFENLVLLSILTVMTSSKQAAPLFLWLLAGTAGAYWFGFFVHDRAYARFCDTLFSLVYLTYRRGH